MNDRKTFFVWQKRSNPFENWQRPWEAEDKILLQSWNSSKQWNYPENVWLDCPVHGVLNIAFVFSQKADELVLWIVQLWGVKCRKGMFFTVFNWWTGLERLNSYKGILESTDKTWFFTYVTDDTVYMHSHHSKIKLGNALLPYTFNINKLHGT